MEDKHITLNRSRLITAMPIVCKNNLKLTEHKIHSPFLFIQVNLNVNKKQLFRFGRGNKKPTYIEQKLSITASQSEHFI